MAKKYKTVQYNTPTTNNQLLRKQIKQRKKTTVKYTWSKVVDQAQTQNMWG